MSATSWIRSSHSGMRSISRAHLPKSSASHGALHPHPSSGFVWPRRTLWIVRLDIPVSFPASHMPARPATQSRHGLLVVANVTMPVSLQYLHRIRVFVIMMP